MSAAADSRGGGVRWGPSRSGRRAAGTGTPGFRCARGASRGAKGGPRSTPGRSPSLRPGSRRRRHPRRERPTGDLRTARTTPGAARSGRRRALPGNHRRGAPRTRRLRRKERIKVEALLIGASTSLSGTPRPSHSATQTPRSSSPSRRAWLRISSSPLGDRLLIPPCSI